DARLVRHPVLRSDGGPALVRRGPRHSRTELPGLSDQTSALAVAVEVRPLDAEVPPIRPRGRRLPAGRVDCGQRYEGRRRLRADPFALAASVATQTLAFVPSA